MGQRKILDMENHVRAIFLALALLLNAYCPVPTSLRGHVLKLLVVDFLLGLDGSAGSVTDLRSCEGDASDVELALHRVVERATRRGARRKSCSRWRGEWCVPEDSQAVMINTIY